MRDLVWLLVLVPFVVLVAWQRWRDRRLTPGARRIQGDKERAESQMW